MSVWIWVDLEIVTKARILELLTNHISAIKEFQKHLLEDSESMPGVAC